MLFWIKAVPILLFLPPFVLTYSTTARSRREGWQTTLLLLVLFLPLATYFFSQVSGYQGSGKPFDLGPSFALLWLAASLITTVGTVLGWLFGLAVKRPQDQRPASPA